MPSRTEKIFIWSLISCKVVILGTIWLSIRNLMRNRQGSSLLACYKPLSISTRKVYCTEISNQRILFSTKMVTLRLLIQVLLEFGTQIILKIPQEHQGTWLQKLCANNLMVLPWTTLPWVSSDTNACLEEDHTQEETEEKSENTFWPNKYKLKELTSQLDGLLRLPILSTD